jgi:uncharacterized protein YqjF (DUF2071 family)
VIRAHVGEDVFFLASLAVERAEALCPPGLRPAIEDGRGWLSVAAVRLKDVRFFGVPAAREALCAAALLLVSFRDRAGRLRKGNYFLEGYTDSRLLAAASALTGGVFRRTSLHLTRRAFELDLTIDDRFAARMDLSGRIARGRQKQMETVFADNRCGVLGVRSRAWYVPLEKSHWRMAGRPVELRDDSLLKRLGARFEFAFDTSHSLGHWFAPRLCHNSLLPE